MSSSVRWNPARDVWETESIDLFSEHSDVFLETWPTSGSMRSGRVFERPTLVPRMAGSVSSYLPTVRASGANGPGSHGTGGDDLRTVVSRL